MLNEKYTDFDLELRSMLQDAEEEVPSRVWSALSEELDRRDRRKVVTLWWRRAGIAVAAAAAVFGAVFIGTRPHDVIAPEAGPAVALVEEAGRADAGIPDMEEQIAASADVLMADVPQTAAAPRRAVTVPSEVPQTVEDVVAREPESVPESAQETAAEPVKPAVKAPVTRTDEPWDDPFAALGRETPKQRKPSFFVSGNATTNDMSESKSQIRKAPGMGGVKDGVQEKSISTYGIPLSLGVGARFSFTDRFSLGTGVEWTLLSRSFTGIYTQGSISVNSEINNELHYIGIPLNLYYNILSNRDIKFYVWGGGSMEKGLVNKFRIQNQSDDIIYKEKVKGLQWSSALGLGIEFALSDKLGLYVDPSVRYYFDCNQPNSVRTAKPYMMNFEAGLRFNL